MSKAEEVFNKQANVAQALGTGAAKIKNKAEDMASSVSSGAKKAVKATGKFLSDVGSAFKKEDAKNDPGAAVAAGAGAAAAAAGAATKPKPQTAPAAPVPQAAPPAPQAAPPAPMQAAGAATLGAATKPKPQTAPAAPAPQAAPSAPPARPRPNRGMRPAGRSYMKKEGAEQKYVLKRKKRTRKQKAKRAASAGLSSGVTSGVLTTLFNAGNPKALKHGAKFGAMVAPVIGTLSYLRQPNYSTHLKRASLEKQAKAPDGKIHSGMTPEEIAANSTPNTYSPKMEKKKGFKGFMQRLIPGGKDGMELNLRDSKGRTPEEFKALPFEERKQHSNELMAKNQKNNAKKMLGGKFMGGPK
tara:strand:+ start:16072 stop:17139 length:1068 start_codon:yes stop_codon:yes gene_type:complete